MIKRQLLQSILLLKEKYPIVAVTGPRQSGKTTLLKNAFPDYQYISLEDPDIRGFAQTDPKGFLKTFSENIIFDEVQQVPHLFSYLQTVVDASGKMGQFILSGSQNFHLLQQITQSLAGRVALFKLLPFDFQELIEENQLADNYTATMIQGFYPAIFDRQIAPSDFYNNYLQTYVQRDLTQLLNVRDLAQFRKFLVLCASRVGQLLNLNSLAQDCGISQPTAKAWLNILESSYIVFQLQPYYENFSKRIIKTPKIFFYDTGLVCHLLGFKSPKTLEINTLKGNLFENMIVSELMKQSFHQNQYIDFYFWRDSVGNEIDLLIPKATQFDIFEIKVSQTINNHFFKGFKLLQQLASEKIDKKILIYGGNTNQSRSECDVVAWNLIKLP
jgi:uncharacterized protein